MWIKIVLLIILVINYIVAIGIFLSEFMDEKIEKYREKQITNKRTVWLLFVPYFVIIYCSINGIIGIIEDFIEFNKELK